MAKRHTLEALRDLLIPELALGHLDNTLGQREAPKNK